MEVDASSDGDNSSNSDDSSDSPNAIGNVDPTSPTSMFGFNSADIKAMDALNKAISSLKTTLADLKAACLALQVANNSNSGLFDLGGPLAR